MTDAPSPDRLRLSEGDQFILKRLKLRRGVGKHAANNALTHIGKAWIIRTIDPEMAMFRAITGEEEAVTAIFHALARHGYPGAEYFDRRKHVHKASVVPFMAAVGRVLTSLPGFHAAIVYNRTGAARPLRTRIDTTLEGLGRVVIRPDPPLSGSMMGSDGVPDFREELRDLASVSGMRSIERFLHERANQRNRYLYASSHGRPHVVGDLTPRLLALKRSVFSLVGIYLLVDETKGVQSFAQQCLDTFLPVLERLDPKMRKRRATALNPRTWPAIW